MYTIAIISFFIGVVLSALVTYIILSKNALAKTEELAKLKARFETAESLQEMIKRDFVQLANETIKN